MKHLFTLAILYSVFSTAYIAAQSDIALTHITIVDVRTGSTRPDMTVVIAGNRISEVRRSVRYTPPKELRVVNADGNFLIPGLWDMHVHTNGEDHPLHHLLAHGITGIRDMGGDAEKLSDARRRIASRELAGPRLLFAGPMLEGPPSEANGSTWIIHSPDEARDAIERLSALHVDFIKVHDGLTRDTYLSIAAAAKEKRLPFAGHVPVSITPAEASDLGQKSIEHLEFIPKSCLVLFDPAARTAHRIPPGCDPQSLGALLHRFAHNRTWLDPTIQSFRYFAPTQWDAIFAGFRELIPRIRENRVSVLAGTDWSDFLEQRGDPPGASLHDELSLLVDAGFTPAEALRAATLNPADFLGLSDSLGTIEAGKVANLVLLDANPLQAIGNAKRIIAVIAEGRYLDRQILDGLLR